MTIVYFDSSAFVKLRGSACGRPSRPTRSGPAAHRRECLGGVLGGDESDQLSVAVAAYAGLLAGEHSLRGADAVHLASLLAVGPAHCILAGWDQRMDAGARLVGVRVFPDGQDADSGIQEADDDHPTA